MLSALAIKLLPTFCSSKTFHTLCVHMRLTPTASRLVKAQGCLLFFPLVKITIKDRMLWQDASWLIMISCRLSTEVRLVRMRSMNCLLFISLFQEVYSSCFVDAFFVCITIASQTRINIYIAVIRLAYLCYLITRLSKECSLAL